MEDDTRQNLVNQITFMETVIDDLTRENKLMKAELSLFRSIINDLHERTLYEPF
jgi:hypothetical protein